jgi:hypothetical protein
MAEWATKHSRKRSPALRRSLIVLVGRSLTVGLLGVLLTCPPWVAAAPTSASGPLPVEIAARDVNGPDVNAERDGDATIAPSGTVRVPIPTGKTARVGGVQRQGSVVAVFADPADPLIVIAVENGYVTVRLRCGTLCPSIHLGDYVVVEGQRRSEAVLDAVDVWVAAP